MSKFVGKFRKNQDYKDDFEAARYAKKKNKSGHSEVKKLKSRHFEEVFKLYEEEKSLKV